MSNGLMAHAAVRQPELSVTKASLLPSATLAVVTPPGSNTPGRCEACGELIARQGVANHHRVGLRAVELTVCLIGDGERPECAAGIEPKWLLFAECDCATRIGAGCRQRSADAP